MKKYKIVLNDSQFELLSKSMDFYNKLITGNFETLHSVIPEDKSSVIINEVKLIINDLESHMFPKTEDLKQNTVSKEMIISDNEILFLIRGTDLISRLYSGQINELKTIIPASKNIDRCKLTELLNLLRFKMFPEFDSNESYGIYNQSLDPRAKELYDMHQVFRYKYSWKNKTDGEFKNVWFDEPLKASEKPLINVTTLP